MSELEIFLLPDEAAAEVIAIWQYREWEIGYREMKFAGFVSEIKKSIGSSRIPVIFAAMIGPEVVGTASIIENDLPSRDDLNPWLASIFVRKEYRNRGIAGALIRTALQHARMLEIDKLFLFIRKLL
jgi:predicted N-acetyltransferase YhbS